MKKSIIAAGAASVALAAMPIVGAFAAANLSSTETINATVGGGCTITGVGDTPGATTASTNIGDVAVNTVSDATAGKPIAITCNSDNWKITAVGAGENGLATALSQSTTVSIPTGTNKLDGSASQWAFKVESSNEFATISGDYGQWSEIPASETTIATGTGTKSGTITPSYIVSVGASQATGSYTGKVTYSVAVTNGS